MQRHPESEKLDALGARIAAAKKAKEPKPKTETKYEKANLAWRMVTELVVGMVMGVGIGYGLDSLFGTLPVFLVIFSLLGFAAGVRTMMRTAEEVQRKRVAEAAGNDDTAATSGTKHEG